MQSRVSFEDRAKLFLSRTPGDHDYEQMIQFISEIFRVECQLVALERRLDNLSAGIWSEELSEIDDQLSILSTEFFEIQRVITSPEDFLSELIDIPQAQVSNKAVSEILTQLGWEWFPESWIGYTLFKNESTGRQMRKTNKCSQTGLSYCHYWRS